MKRLVLTRQALRRLPPALPSDDDLDLLLEMFRGGKATKPATSRHCTFRIRSLTVPPPTPEMTAAARRR